MGAVQVNGVRLGYRQAGDPDGMPVLMLHGSTSNAQTWEPFTPHLVAAGHRAIAVDLRGHGTSDRTAAYSLDLLRDDVLGLLDVLDLRDAVLVGHSVGAHAALAAARWAPARVARLVLEDLSAPPRRAAPLAGVGPMQLLAAIASMKVVRRDYELRAVRAIFRQLSRPDPVWWSGLSAVRQPTLILSGGPDSCIPPRRLADVTTALRDARLATIPVGHRVHTLAPDEFAAEVTAFLTETAAYSLP